MTIGVKDGLNLLINGATTATAADAIPAVDAGTLDAARRNRLGCWRKKYFLCPFNALQIMLPIAQQAL